MKLTSLYCSTSEEEPCDERQEAFQPVFQPEFQPVFQPKVVTGQPGSGMVSRRAIISR